MTTSHNKKLTREEVLRRYNPENNDRLYPRRGEQPTEEERQKFDPLYDKAYHRPKKKTLEDLEEEQKTRQLLSFLGVDTEDLETGSTAGQLPTAVTPADRSDPEVHPTWRQADEEFAGFLRDIYDLPVTGVSTGIRDGQRRVEFDEDNGQFSIDMLCVGLPGPVDEGPGMTWTVDDPIPYGPFDSPTLQIAGARIFGLIHQEFATLHYSRWREWVAEDASEEVLADLAAVDAYDVARAQCSKARSSMWMHPVMLCGWIPWATDPAALPGNTPTERLQWLITRIILPAAGTLLPDDAALVARQEVARHIGEDTLEKIINWWTPLGRDLNPTTSTMLAGGHALRSLWDDLAAHLDVDSADSPVVDVEGPLDFAVQAVEAIDGDRIYAARRQWPTQPWPPRRVRELMNRPKLGPAALQVNSAGLPSDHGVEYRTADEDDFLFTREIRRTLAKAKARKFGVSAAPSRTPGGRLNTRQLVQMQAQRAAGRTITATPWSRRQAHQNGEPDIHVGFVGDLSASMRNWRSTMARMGWSMASAVSDLGGACSAWGFTDGASPIVRPGFINSRNVPTFTGHGADSSGCADALREAAREAQLHTGTGAKVSIVVTDGDLPQLERDAIQAEVDAQRDAGISVYWVQASPVPVALWVPNGAKVMHLKWAKDFDREVLATIVSEVKAA